MITHHIPGIANKVADELSRWPEPGHNPQVPDFLASAVRVFPGARTDNFFDTMNVQTVPYQAGK